MAKDNEATTNRTRRVPPRRRGVTLIEMLVAMAITLLMMASVATIFSQLGTAINDSRSGIEMSSRLRHVRNRLQLDLAGHTCRALPWRRPEAGEGYIEYVEGLHNDDPWATFPASGKFPEGGPTLLTLGAESLVDRSALGDYDDVLMLTVRSRGEPFVGMGVLLNGRRGMVESPDAEVIWFALENGDGLRTLYRRVLLVAPWQQDIIMSTQNKIRNDLTGKLTLFQFQTKYDLSARIDPATGNILLNSLADVTRRESRFFHNGVAFPHSYPIAEISSSSLSIRATAAGGEITGGSFQNAGFQPGMTIAVRSDTGNAGIYTVASVGNSKMRVLEPPANNGVILEVLGTPAFSGFSILPGNILREGEDVMLDNVLAFDVRAYDPGAPLFAVGNTVVAPGDSGYVVVRKPNAPVAYGAFVDLNYYLPLKLSDVASPNVPESFFHGRPKEPNFYRRWVYPSNAPARRSQLSVPTYDTWSFHYEHDGLDQDGDNETDEGTDGFDSDGLNGVDDMAERETSPPYPLPLRAIQVRVRAYEPTSRQIREVSIEQSFVPE